MVLTVGSPDFSWLLFNELLNTKTGFGEIPSTKKTQSGERSAVLLQQNCEVTSQVRTSESSENKKESDKNLKSFHYIQK